MVKVIFGEREILIGKGQYLPIYLYSIQRSVTKQQVQDWIKKGRMIEGEDFIEIKDLDVMLIRDTDYRIKTRMSAKVKTEILRMTNQGYSYAEIGRKFGLNRGHIFTIVRRANA